MYLLPLRFSLTENNQDVKYEINFDGLWGKSLVSGFVGFLIQWSSFSVTLGVLGSSQSHPNLLLGKQRRMKTKQ